MLYETHWKPLLIEIMKLDRSYAILQLACFTKKLNDKVNCFDFLFNFHCWKSSLSINSTILDHYGTFIGPEVHQRNATDAETGLNRRIQSSLHEKISVISYNVHAFSPTATQSNMWGIECSIPLGKM